MKYSLQLATLKMCVCVCLCVNGFKFLSHVILCSVTTICCERYYGSYIIIVPKGK